MVPDRPCSGLSSNALLDLQYDLVELARRIGQGLWGHRDNTNGAPHPEGLRKVGYCAPRLPQAEGVGILAPLNWRFIRGPLVDFALKLPKTITDGRQLIDVDEHSRSDRKRAGLPHSEPGIRLNLPFSLCPEWVIGRGTTGALVIHDHLEVRRQLRAARDNGLSDYVGGRDTVQLHVGQNINNAMQLVPIGSQIGRGSGSWGRNIPGANNAFLGRRYEREEMGRHFIHCRFRTAVCGIPGGAAPGGLPLCPQRLLNHVADSPYIVSSASY